MATEDPIVGYNDFEDRGDGVVMATALRESGATERTQVRITVEREIRRAGGELVAAGVVADSDPSGPGEIHV